MPPRTKTKSEPINPCIWCVMLEDRNWYFKGSTADNVTEVAKLSVNDWNTKFPKGTYDPPINSLDDIDNGIFLTVFNNFTQAIPEHVIFLSSYIYKLAGYTQIAKGLKQLEDNMILNKPFNQQTDLIDI